MQAVGLWPNNMDWPYNWMSPIFLYARGRHDLDQASPHFAAMPYRLQLSTFGNWSSRAKKGTRC